MAYATYLELCQRYPSLEQQHVASIEDELTAVSQWIDGYCGRNFDAETSVTVRYFAATNRMILDLGPYEISTTDGVIVATDDGTGAYATTLASTAYQLEPVNAVYEKPSARPFTQLRAISTLWPIAYSANDLQERVKVTAKYGWPSVPTAVKNACITLTAAVFENPTGAAAESIDGYSVTYRSSTGDSFGVPSSVLGRLGPFVRSWAV